MTVAGEVVAIIVTVRVVIIVAATVASIRTGTAGKYKNGDRLAGGGDGQGDGSKEHHLG